MAYCRLEDTFCDDPKWDLVAEAAQIDRVTVCGHVALLWSFAIRHAPDGVLGHVTKSYIARISGASDTKIADAFVRFAVIDETENGFVIHGYGKRAMSYNRAKQKAKERLSKSQKNAPKRQRSDKTKLSRDSRTTSKRQNENVAATFANVAYREEMRGDEMKGDIIQIQEHASATAPAPSDTTKSDERTAIENWHNLYLQKTGKKYEAWDGRHTKALRSMMAKYRDGRIIELMEKYFEWPNEKVIEEAWPFCSGYASFQCSLIKLSADLVAWDRHQSAAEVVAHKREALSRAAHVAQRKRIFGQIEREEAQRQQELPGVKHNAIMG